MLTKKILFAPKSIDTGNFVARLLPLTKKNKEISLLTFSYKEIKMYTEKQEYITNKQHSIFPAGTKCWISREYADSPLKIEFDGLIIFSNCYAKNIEEQLSPIERQIKESRWTIIEKNNN